MTEKISMRLKHSDGTDQREKMGYDITNVTNKFGKELDLVVRHSNSKCDILTITDQEIKVILTEKGNVTISVFDPEDPVYKEIPIESKTIPSNKNVTIEKDVRGTLRIRRSLGLIKHESRKRLVHSKLALF